MKVIIFGGRDLTDYGLVVEAVFLAKCGILKDMEITEVVSGACGIDADDPDREDIEAKGGDGLGELWAKTNGIPVKRFYAAWKRLGKPAGPIRNGKMGKYADAGISLSGGFGTANMAKQLRGLRKPMFEIKIS
jgi:hypothetical protein